MISNTFGLGLTGNAGSLFAAVAAATVTPDFKKALRFMITRFGAPGGIRTREYRFCRPAR